MKARRELYLGGGLTLALLLAGCPITDDYYLLDAAAGRAGSNQSGTAPGGSAPEAGTSSDGGGPAPGTGGAGSSAGGATDGLAGLGGAGEPGEAGAPSLGSGGQDAEPCVPATERCNGHDDDCDELVDEFACFPNCSGFVLPEDPAHGYMFCTGARRAAWDAARRACQDQDMRLAWIESAEENEALTQKLDALAADPEILIGATDQGSEGYWTWLGGDQFWRGDEDGYPVADRFNAWTEGTPNNSNNEDCALLMTATGTWGDRVCNSTYPYVCEQPD